MSGFETPRNLAIRFIHKNIIFLLLLCHCLLLHVANVSLDYPVRRSQQQFDTYEEDPYWKTSVHLHTTELMGGTIHKAACFLGQESCHMLGTTCKGHGYKNENRKSVEYGRPKFFSALQNWH